MNRSRRHALLAPLLAVVALVLGLMGSASAAFNHAATEPHYGNFLLWESEASGFSAYEFADPTKENGEWIYDGALGVPVYVTQNPWTKFDPYGLWETDSYWGDVGQVWVGYGRAIKGTAVCIGTMVAHPVQTAKGIGNAIASPIQTGKAIIADYEGKLQSNAGVGEIVGEVLIGVATGGSVKALDKASDVADIAKITNKIDNAADVGGDSARLTQKVSEEAADAATPKVGDNVTRHWGGESGPDGQSWTRDPASAQTRENLGLGRSNTGEFVSEGTLVDTTGVTSKKATEWDGFSGGGDEVVIPDPQNQVRLNSVRMPDEPLPDK